MWLLDRIRRKRDEEATRGNDRSLPLASMLIRSVDRPTLQRAIRSAARQSYGNVEIVVCGMANFRDGDLARAETLLSKATKRLPKHAGLRENLAADPCCPE